MECTRGHASHFRERMITLIEHSFQDKRISRVVSTLYSRQLGESKRRGASRKVFGSDFIEERIILSFN
jgi:hypothetical protein